MGGGGGSGDHLRTPLQYFHRPAVLLQIEHQNCLQNNERTFDLRKNKTNTTFFFLYVNCLLKIFPLNSKKLCLYNKYVYFEIFHIANMYILKSYIIHLFSYMKEFRRTSGDDPGMGQEGPSPLGTKIFFFLVNLQNTRKINKIESGPPFLKILDPPLNFAALTTTAQRKRHRNYELKNKLD